MTYRELIELYKQGKLEEKKRKEVEGDIEKQDAISEYLFDRDEREVFDYIEEESESSREDNIKERNGMTNKGESKDFVKMINRSIRRAFVKMGAVVTALILAAVLFVQFGLPKVVASYYYNPNRMIGEDTNQMSLDMAVYTELFVPGCRRDNVIVTDNGYGNYEFIVKQNRTMNGIFTDVSGKINRNKLTFYNTNIIDPPSSNVFEWSNPDLKPTGTITEQMKKLKEEYGEDDNLHFGYCPSGTPELAKDSIEELEDDKLYNAYISLDKIMEYDNFIKFIERYDGLSEVWCAPVISDNKERLDVNNVGFTCSFSGLDYIEWDKTKYPNLQMWDQNEEETIVDEIKSEDLAISHFTNMVRYMCEQKDFCKMMQIDSLSEYIAEYVEKNGLNIYGFYTTTDKEALLKLMDEKEIYTIYVTEIK